MKNKFSLFKLEERRRELHQNGITSTFLDRSENKIKYFPWTASWFYDSSNSSFCSHKLLLDSSSFWYLFGLDVKNPSHIVIHASVKTSFESNLILLKFAKAKIKRVSAVRRLKAGVHDTLKDYVSKVKTHNFLTYISYMKSTTSNLGLVLSKLKQHEPKFT